VDAWLSFVALGLSLVSFGLSLSSLAEHRKRQKAWSKVESSVVWFKVEE
jgi:inner membrane protein involved in colicin E2 resistance